jgi:hypothetical protein
MAFARRWNYDSSVDSICLKCYQTVARAETEMGLAPHEENHSCNPFGEWMYSRQTHLGDAPRLAQKTAADRGESASLHAH